MAVYGNPVLFPLFSETETRDVVILHSTPSSARPLQRQITDIQPVMRFVQLFVMKAEVLCFVNAVDGTDQDSNGKKLKQVLIHRRADIALSDLSVSSNSPRLDFLTCCASGRSCCRGLARPPFRRIVVRLPSIFGNEFLLSCHRSSTHELFMLMIGNKLAKRYQHDLPLTIIIGGSASSEYCDRL